MSRFLALFRWLAIIRQLLITMTKSITKLAKMRVKHYRILRQRSCMKSCLLLSFTVIADIVVVSVVMISIVLVTGYYHEIFSFIIGVLYEFI